MLLSFVLLFISLILESSLTTIPLVFVFLLCLTVVYKENFLFFLAFIFGILLDVLSFKTIGTSSIFFVTFLFLILTYQRKFEIRTYPFILISSFLGSLGYLLFVGYTNSIIFQSVISSFLGVLIFYFLNKSIKQAKTSSDNI